MTTVTLDGGHLIPRTVVDVAKRLQHYRREGLPHFMIGENTTPTLVRTLFRPLAWGRMWVHRTIRLYEGERWGFDNGAFGAYSKGEPWSEEKYLKRLDAAYALGTPVLAVVPDVVGDGQRSLDFSLEWLGKLPTDWPWYLAVQDGMTADMVRPHLRKFAGLFLGGTREFKQTAQAWRDLAGARGLRFHYARCSTIRKLEHAKRVRAHSCDSAQPLWEKKSLERHAAWYRGQGQGVLV